MSRSKGFKIGIAVAAGVAACDLVFGIMMLTREKIDYAGAREKTTAIIDTRAAVEKFLNGSASGAELSSEDMKAGDVFVEAHKKMSDNMSAIAASNVMKDEAVKGKFEAAKTEFEKYGELASIWNDIKLLQNLSDENLATLKQSKSELLRTMADELGDYRAKVKEYKDKYSNKAGDSKEALNAYGQLQLLGTELETKYKNVTFESVTKMSRDDILKYYATIEELNKILSEKV